MFTIATMPGPIDDYWPMASQEEQRAARERALAEQRERERQEEMERVRRDAEYKQQQMQVRISFAVSYHAIGW